MKLTFCAACGATDDLEHHHLIMRSEGGSNDERNLITLCTSCHRKLHEQRMNRTYISSQRVRQTKADQRQRGRFLGGIRPFGYRHTEDGTLVEDAAEQAAIDRIHELHDEGLSLRAIADWLDKEGFKLSHGGVKRILDRAARSASSIR